MITEISELLNKLDSNFWIKCYTPYSDGYLLYFRTIDDPIDLCTFKDIADILMALEFKFNYTEYDSFDGETLTIFVANNKEHILWE